jgi:3-phenylpropionate/trans-cinnamate dioxygenase ferredoxin reductase subunit
MLQAPCIAIVGAGHAGTRAAFALREQGWTGRILLVGEEDCAPYERPPLSKHALLTPEAPAAPIAEPARYGQQGIELVTGTRVTAIDTARRCLVMTTDGAPPQTVAYDKLLLATGGRARPLDIPGADDPRILTLRDRRDAARLAGRLGAGTTLAVLGGGFIGLEAAAAARQRGSDVVLLEAGPRLLGRAVPASLAALVHGLHAERGLDIRLGDAAAAFEPGQDRIVVRCVSGAVVAADTVVVAIGMSPDVSLARAAGLAVGRGILVDRSLRTSAPDVYAAGDACEFPGAGGGGTLVMESWANAQAQAELAARNMLGDAAPYQPATWMWSDQYDCALQMVGRCGDAAAVVTRVLPGGGRLEFHLDAAQRIVGAAGLAPATALGRAFLIARRLVDAGAQRSPADLADPDCALKSLLAAGR